MTLTPERLAWIRRDTEDGHSPGCDCHPTRREELEPSCSCYLAERRELVAWIAVLEQDRDTESRSALEVMSERDAARRERDELQAAFEPWVRGAQRAAFAGWDRAAEVERERDEAVGLLREVLRWRNGNPPLHAIDRVRAWLSAHDTRARDKEPRDG